MSNKLLDQVLRRAGHRCAWCDLDMRQGPASHLAGVCYLGPTQTNDTMVAACMDCRIEFDRWWIYSVPYSVENAKRVLGHDPVLGFSPFVGYLERRTGKLFAFNYALARVEAQRNAPLELRQTRAA